MGTPRQPQLVPASRAFVQITAPPATLSNIEDYSHVWIIFEFHANTDTTSTAKAKIRPPRAGGIKVGQLATRSPHRPNALGLSLVNLERWDEPAKRLYVTGIDLVNGTPVYDIKPFVPWDIPGFPETRVPAMRVPDWVDQDDAIATVLFTPNASCQLKEVVAQGLLKPLYSDYGPVHDTIVQILAQDPRSTHKGVRNARGSATSTYSFVFGSLMIAFAVQTDPPRVDVTAVEPVSFDSSQYVDGIPLQLVDNRNDA